MDCPPIPQFCLDFLLRSKTYLKEHPPSGSIVNRNLSRPEHVVRLVYTHYKVQTRIIMYSWCKLCCCTLVYTSIGCLAHDTTNCLHPFERLVVDNTDSSNVGPPPCLSPR